MIQIISWIWVFSGVLLILLVLLHSPKGDGMGGIAASGSSMFNSASSAEASLNKIKLRHSDFKKLNPKIITANAVGFSSEGPYAGLPAFDDTIQAISGMAAYQGVYSSQPSYTSGATADKVTGIMLGMSILGALFNREKNGTGAEIEVPMMETMVDFTLVEHLYGFNFIPPKAPPVYPRQSSPNRRPYKTKDGFVAVLPYSDEQWLRFFKLVGKKFANAVGTVPSLVRGIAFLCCNSDTLNPLSKPSFALRAIPGFPCNHPVRSGTSTTLDVPGS